MQQFETEQDRDRWINKEITSLQQSAAHKEQQVRIRVWERGGDNGNWPIFHCLVFIAIRKVDDYQPICTCTCRKVLYSFKIFTTFL